MPVEITILSGQRQGERIELAGNSFEVGDQPTDAVHFDAATDPEVKGHRASLRLEEGGWQIRSTGKLPIIVNHDPVEKPHALRSGDIVRMSERGPDFSFALINRLSAVPNAKSVSAGSTTAAVASTPAAAPSESDRKTESKPVPIRFVVATVASVATVLGVIVLATLFTNPGASRVTNSPSPRLAHIPVMSVDEGKELLWHPEVLDAEGVDGLAYALSSESPPGMRIDRNTGAIRWTPTEAQAPGEYACELVLTWSSDSQTQTSTAKILCKTREINQTPTLDPIPMQTLDLLQGGSLDLVVTAVDLDQPTQQMTFRLGADAPSDMRMEASSGRITWTPHEIYANQLLTVPITVTDDGVPPLSTTAELKISVIYPDPWEVAGEKMRPALYLVGVQPTDSPTMLPLGTACAITADTLLTSATVSTSLREGQQRGWKVVAIQSTKLDDFRSNLLPIIDLEAHVGYVKADPETQIFFDLGLLKVSGRIEATCQLVSAETLADLAAEPQSLACIGFSLDGSVLTRFDLPAAELRRAELFSVIPLPESEGGEFGGPPLLQLSAELPAHPFGSPIITREAQLVGVYATQAAISEPSDQSSIHYAPVVTLVSAWLAGEGQSHWVQPEPATATPLKEEAN